MRLPPGLYDLIVIEAAARAIDALDPGSASVEELSGTGAAERLIGGLREQLARVLQDLESGSDEVHVLHQLRLINDCEYEEAYYRAQETQVTEPALK